MSFKPKKSSEWWGRYFKIVWERRPLALTMQTKRGRDNTYDWDARYWEKCKDTWRDEYKDVVKYPPNNPFRMMTRRLGGIRRPRKIVMRYFNER